MTRKIAWILTGLGLVGWMLGPVCSVQAHGDEEEGVGHSHEKSEKHGGHVIMTETHHFEVVFDAYDIRIYVYDREQNPLDLSSTAFSGTVTLEFKDENKKSETFPVVVIKKGTKNFSYELNKTPKGEVTPSFTRSFSPPERDQDFLFVFAIQGKDLDTLREVDFSEFHPGDVKAIFTLRWLSKEGKEKIERFVAPLLFSHHDRHHGEESSEKHKHPESSPPHHD